ncbi:MAG: metalloregulator ArsR/SmtB family transcription factor [Firmicutes bacterium]|nr:metalloregulator ArsR/SmtB family transcription factor [Bacillota bacterium]
MKKVVSLCKMLSDETRFRIIMLLYQEELCVCEICGILDLSQPKVSRHLAKLRDTGFVRDQRKEQFVFYYLDVTDPVIVAMIEVIVNNISQYPLCQMDLERLADKEQFMQSCKTE